MRFRLRSLVRRVLQLTIAFLVLLSLGGLLLFTVYSFFPSISIPYLLPAQEVTEDTVFYRRSWREPFEYDIKVYASQSANVTAHNATAFFESAQLLWHVQQQSLEKKFPKYGAKVKAKVPESMFSTMKRERNIYAHVFIQKSDQFTPHPNISDPYLVQTSMRIFSVYGEYYYNTWAHSMSNETLHASLPRYYITYWPSLSWDLVLEDHTYTNKTLPKVFRPWINDSPSEGSKTGTYNPPLVYRSPKGYRNMRPVPAEIMPKPTNSNGQSSSLANTDRTLLIGVDLTIQGISQGWVRGEDTIRKLAEPKLERKTRTITWQPHYYRSESNMAYGKPYSGQFGSAKSTAAVSSGNIGSARPSINDVGEYEGHKNEVVVSASEGVTEVEYTALNSNLLPRHILSSANVLSVVLLVVSMPLVVALLLAAFSGIAAFWSREDTKWEGTSRLAVVLDVVYQCSNLVLMYTQYTISDRANSIAYFYAGLSLWVFAVLYNIPLNPFKWRQRVASLRAPASSEIPKPVLAGNDNSSSTVIRVGGLPRMGARDLAASIQQEVDQQFKWPVLVYVTTLVIRCLVYIAVTPEGYSRRSKLRYVVKNILYMIKAFQLVPQVVINYRTKSVAWIPIAAYMCELLVNIHQILVDWTFRWPVFFSPVPAGSNWIHCLLLAVFAVQWAKYYKAKQD
ncbi:hypothetical protein GQ54DRAFT_299315 [Martensiomyces pterosporus]|nr:hypothetical protein GQ54DRAFT_299315 [Martensiomyces pterosporus]